MEKVKATVYVSKDTWERAKALFEGIPGFSASSLIDSVLQQMVPDLERFLEMAKQGDAEAMVQFMDTFTALKLGTLGSEFSTVRRELLEKARKEDTN